MIDFDLLQTIDDLKVTLGPIIEEIVEQRKAEMVTDVMARVEERTSLLGQLQVAVEVKVHLGISFSHI